MLARLQVTGRAPPTASQKWEEKLRLLLQTANCSGFKICFEQLVLHWADRKFQWRAIKRGGFGKGPKGQARTSKSISPIQFVYAFTGINKHGLFT